VIYACCVPTEYLFPVVGQCRFSADYFRDPRRGYGQSVSTVFTKLRFGVADVYQPAAEQFSGRGSFGNGSAMRVAPVALFAYQKKDTLIEVRVSIDCTLEHSFLMQRGSDISEIQYAIPKSLLARLNANFQIFV